MNAQNLWQVFLDTGSPEMYLLYSQARRVEEHHVPDDQGARSESYKLQ